MSDTSGLPAGFQLEDDPGTPPTGSSGLPSGFELQADPGALPGASPHPPSAPTSRFGNALSAVGGDLAGPTGAGVGDVLGTAIGNVPASAENAAVDAYRFMRGEPSETPAISPGLNESGKSFIQKIGSAPGLGGTTVAGDIDRVRQGIVEQDEILKQNRPGLASVVHGATRIGGDLAQLAPVAAPLAAGATGLVERAFASAPEEVLKSATPTAEENLAAQVAASKGNVGAAVTAPSLVGTSPELKDVVANAKNINHDALLRQIDAETLPLPDGMQPLQLRKGQAIGDAQQISDEKNLRADPDTQGLLSKSITDQNAKLGAAMGEIRTRATPAIVQRSTPEHGQTAVDAIKSQDNEAVKDIRTKYKALADQNAGAMPIDTGTAADSITAALSKGFLTKTAAQNPVISEIMDGITSGQPMSFESFENARTNLAGVQRGAAPADAKAAEIVRNELENMPLSDEASNLKGLADTARKAAKARFSTIEQNPAYEAAINDNVPKGPNGLHVIGVPSPLADTFMDRYFLGNGQTASRAYVARMQTLLGSNPDFSQAVEASALNKLRNSAGLDEFDSGSFRNDSYRNARNAMVNKADVLMSPQSAESTDQLKRVSGYVNDEGKAATVNRSNTALTLQRFGAPPAPSSPGVAGTLADYAADVGAAHTGPVGYAVKKIGSGLLKNAREAKAAAALKAAKLKFAQEAVAPGAGIDMGATPPAGGRTSGGKVDHEVLVSRLLDRWHSARKASNKTTEPLLHFPDETIRRALEISGRPST